MLFKSTLNQNPEGKERLDRTKEQERIKRKRPSLRKDEPKIGGTLRHQEKNDSAVRPWALCMIMPACLDFKERISHDEIQDTRGTMARLVVVW